MTGVSVQGDHTPDAKQVEGILATIGTLVIFMQTAERVIATTLSLALPESPIQSVDDLTKETEANDKATLGALIKKLNRRVELDDDFAEVLEAFLIDRNALIHDVHRIPGFGLKTNVELAETSKFLRNLVENSQTVTRVFISLLVEWGAQIGSSLSQDEQIREFLGDLDGIATSIFFAKPAQ
ncbi:hypothetical protein NKH49_26920 [Mesorhizobium sp. M1088]|uniref:hypothetical protein n=1 Tax=Mesorhizobium sp. M1088 TaxID=2957056 RepID=UPI003337EDB9